MEIHNSLDGLNSLLGINPSSGTSPGSKSAATSGTALGNDRATLSNAASEVAQSASDDDVRMNKVASIQAALAAGTYDVSASAVAGKLIDSMLGS